MATDYTKGLKWADFTGDNPVSFLTVDPGELHVGVAYWQGQHCTQAWETDPQEFVKWLASTARDMDFIGYERFILDPRRSKFLGGYEFVTCELIGVIKYHSQLRGLRSPIGYSNVQGKVCYKIKPWSTWPHRSFTSYGHGSHAKDANVAGYSLMRAVRKAEGLTDASWTEMH